MPQCELCTSYTADAAPVQRKTGAYQFAAAVEFWCATCRRKKRSCFRYAIPTDPPTADEETAVTFRPRVEELEPRDTPSGAEDPVVLPPDPVEQSPPPAPTAPPPVPAPVMDPVNPPK